MNHIDWRGVWAKNLHGWGPGSPARKFTAAFTRRGEVQLGSTEFSLEQNHPNAFNPTITIRYTLPRRCYVTLRVFSILGQHIATLVNGKTKAGYHEIPLDANGLASGIYFYRLKAGRFVDTKKFLLDRQAEADRGQINP